MEKEFTVHICHPPDFRKSQNDLYKFYKIVYFIDSKDSSYGYYRGVFCALSDDSL